MKVLEGNLVAQNIKVALVAARFNEFIVSKLISGAVDGLKRHNVTEDDITLAWVPGAFEIPLIASKLAKTGKYDAQYKYEEICSEKTGKNAGEVFLDWVSECSSGN